MNLNHIAKKPFFDLFYRSPCMAQILRAAIFDAGAFNRASTLSSNRGVLRFATESQRSENPDIDFAIEQIE